MNKPDAFQVAMFENCLDYAAIQFLHGFSFTTSDENRTVKEIMEKLEEHPVGQINDTMERYIFYQHTQQEGEDFDSFLADVRRLSPTCKFCNDCEASMICYGIILGIREDDTRKSLLKERGLE